MPLANALADFIMHGAVDGVGCLHHFLIGFELTVDLNHVDHFGNNLHIAQFMQRAPEIGRASCRERV